MNIFSCDTAPDGTHSLLEILQQEGRFASAPCGGKGTCGKCVVRYRKNPTPPSEADMEKLTKEQRQNGFRLACQSYPGEPFEVELSEMEEQIQVETGSFWQMRSREQEKTGNKAGTEQQRREKTKHQAGQQPVSEKENTPENRYGIAVDIGSTTLAAVLIHLDSGERLQTAASVNHQRVYGADVLSRIQASNAGRKWEMQRCIRQDLKQLFAELAKKEGIQAEQVEKIVVAGNTTMCHLLKGYSCQTLGAAPFTPVDISCMKGTAEQLLGMRGLFTETVILPGISAFVGADITAGMAAVGLAAGEEYCLLLDIGTNGEMTLGNREQIYATATSAGPAFEGGNISCGMAGVPGAVVHVKLKEDGQSVTEVIGGGKAAGICGTGIIDVTAELLRHGLLDEHGTFTEQYFEKGYPLAEGVLFTQKDVRELQMAKAAIRAGMEILMKKAGVEPEQIKTCYLAGGFGTQIAVEQAVQIGLIPASLQERTVAAGNTVLEGAIRYLTGRIAEEDCERIVQITEEVNLAMEPEFEEQYLEQMDF